MMTTEHSLDFSKFIPKINKKGLPPPPQQPEPSVFSGHEKLFSFYGISLETLRSISDSGITTLSTKDGDLVIDAGTKTIIAPLEYYSRQKIVL